MKGISVRVCFVSLFAIIILSFLQAGAFVAPFHPPQAQPSGPKIWLGENQPIAAKQAGAFAAAAGVGQGAAAQPLSIASGDVDGDGVADLVVGYSGGFVSVFRGNLDALAPQSDASLQGIASGQFPAPFKAEALSVAVPVNPDFLALGDFIGNGQLDLIVAARGGSAFYVLSGDGKGNFSAPQTVNVQAGITALASGEFGSPRRQTIVVGTKSGLQVFSKTPQGLTAVGSFSLAAAPSNILFGEFGDPGPDAAFLSGGKVFILRSSNLKVETVSLPVNAVAMAVGGFIYDRNPNLQIALLASDGSIQIAAHNEFDSRPLNASELKAIRAAGLRGHQNPLSPVHAFPVNGWKIVETFPSVGTVAPGRQPVFFRGRVSSNGADDIVWLNASSGQMALISHPNLSSDALGFVPGQVSTRPYNGSPTAAVSAWVNVAARPGIVAIHQGEAAPSVMMPLPDPTFFVNRFDDPVPGTLAATCNNISNTDTSSSCSLREAILKANSVPNEDTVQLVAGTYTLSQPRVAGDFSGQHGTLEVTDSISITGAVDGTGAPASIIQAGTTNANGVDKIMSINEDITVLTTASAHLTNLVLRFGRNLGDALTLQDGFGGAFDFDVDNSGATLTITNCTITDNQTTDGEGGGFEIFNTGGTAATTGFAQISNSTVQNNKTRRSGVGDPNAVGNGGGITIAFPAKFTMTNTKVLNNDATQVQGTGIGTAGGLFLIGGSNFDNPTSITGGQISGNQAAGDGGGIWGTTGLTISGGTVISGNTAGTSGTGSGGGIWFNAASPRTGSITHSTITGNAASATAGFGGGLEVSTGAGLSLTLTANRIAGNTAHTGTNLDWQSVAGATVNAANNWWGTNTPSATITKTGTGTLTTDPFYVLTHTGTPAKIRINQSSTLTGDLGHDNHGTAVAAANLDQIVGLPITFASGPLGTIPQAQPETLNASAVATATFNAGGTSGRANPTAVVDQETALANDNLIATATEAGTTVTITTVGAHGFSTGETAVISGVGVSGYNGTFIITATPTGTTFTYTDPNSGLGASSGGTANVGIVILEPPSITKSFGAATIPVNGTTTVSFSINNPNVVAINTSFTDTLPTGLQVAATPGVTNTCGGTVTATAGSGSISFSNNLTPVGVCSISVNITGTVDNNYTNSVTIDSTDAGNGNTSSANLTVINPPSIAKAFGAATIPLNGTTSLTFTLSSTNQNLTLNGVAFTDNLPPGLVVATPPNVSGSCTGTVTATAGASSVSLSGQTLAPGASCTVVADVQGTTAGVKNNSVQVTSTNAGTGNTSNASITVVGPPVIIKAFGAASIPLNGSTSLSFTINNPNTTVTLSGVAFSDTLPAGLVISTPNGLTGSCGGGTITATQATNVISLSGASIAASSSCTFSVNVTGIAAGSQNNTTGNVTSTEGGTGGTASASVTVVAPPSIAKAFNPSSIALNATTSLTFTITNPAANVDPLTGVAFTDTLPTGLTVANSTSTVCGGTLTTTAPTGISLAGATIAASGQCQFSVTVTGAASGQYTNTTGAVTSTNGGTGNTASANLTVASPPSITKAFGAATIPLNGTTSLTFSISNPNTGLTLTGIAFTDNLPAGLVVASTPNLSNTCGGTATAVGGSGSVSLSAGTLAASASCTVSVNVTGTTAGVKNNSVTVASTEAGTGNTSNASITVVSPPTIAKAFGAASIPLNGSTSLSFTVSNPNTTVALSGVAFSDTLPAGLVISTPNGLTGSCGTGTITATQGTNVITLSGGTLAANSSCTFSVNVTGIAAGTQNNTSGAVTSTEGGTGNTASASINVVAPPSIAKAFNPANIALNATTSLTFTITNPAANTLALTGVAFTDTLPTGLTVANSTSTVCGGTLTTTAPTGIALSGATIAANAQCQFSVTVTAAAAGQYTNTTGNVTSTNGGTGNTASANLTVATPPTITKAFGAASILLNGTTSVTFTLNNPNASLALTGVAFSDTLPAGLQVATPNGLTTTCSGTVTAAGGSGSISLTGASLAANASCKVAVNVTGVAAGVQNNTTGPVSSNESGPGATSNTATITVIGPPSIAKAFGAASINLNASTTLSFTITNPNATVALSGVAFTDTLPTGIVVANPNGLTGSCGSGTITTSSSSVSLSGGTIAAGGSCTFSVNVTGTTSGHKVNTTGAVSSTNAGTGNQATASIDVLAPDPTITKTHVGTFKRAQTGAQWTITVSNVGFGPTTGTVTVVDTLPNVQNPPVPTAISGTGWTCTLATLTCTRSDALASGSSYPPITLTVNIPKNIQNNFTNTAKVSGGGDVNPNNNTATDPISLGPPIVMTPQSSSATTKAGGQASMIISVDAPDPTLGVITFNCSGLPTASSCLFNPVSIDPSVTAGPTNVTVSVATTKGSASLLAPELPGRHGHAPLFAMLSVPLFGIVLTGLGGQRAKGFTRWAVLILIGLLLLLALAGCGVAPAQPPPVPGTPTGTFTVTVSGTSAATAVSPSFTATGTFSLVVQ